MSDRSDPRTTTRPNDAGKLADAREPAGAGKPPEASTPEQAEVDKRDPSGGPTTLGWWLDDGPDSPIAADIKEPAKAL